MTESAFDRIATQYDRDFTDTRLARILREAVWMRLARHIRPGSRVLEIGCGTGEDAVWLARQGAHVLATDVSQAMLDVTRQKAQRAGVADRVETQLLDAAAPLSRVLGEGPGVRAAFSNFGALNCVGDLHPIAHALAEWVPPGGGLVLVLINRWCAWEIAWHLLHLQPRVAFRRLRRDGVDARVGGGTVHTWYPSIGSIRRTFTPHFELKRVTGLGVCLPPSYLEPVVARRPRLFLALSRIERSAASTPVLKRLADHVILEFERTASA
ncbi:MAG TPA: methyltransferase domain-containing protein [Anaerolineae bacterium]